MRVALVALALSFPAYASLEEDGVWEGGVWASTVWEDDVWFENDPGVTVPNVVGLSLADADIALEAVSLDTGTTTAQCSGEAADEVLAQSPIAGASAQPASLVNLTYSDGMECASATRRPSIRVGIGIGVTQ